MSTVVIKYDARNSMARKILEIISMFDFFEIEKKEISERKKRIIKKVVINGIDEAIDDVKNGKTTTYNNFDEYKNDMRKIIENV